MLNDAIFQKPFSETYVFLLRTTSWPSCSKRSVASFPRHVFTPYDCLLISVAFVVICRVGCLWLTGVLKENQVYSYPLLKKNEGCFFTEKASNIFWQCMAFFANRTLEILTSR